MKKRFLLPVIALVVAGASGCTSVPNSNVSPYGEYDEAYVAAVERSARRAGVDVYWNENALPQKRSARN